MGMEGVCVCIYRKSCNGKIWKYFQLKETLNFQRFLLWWVLVTLFFFVLHLRVCIQSFGTDAKLAQLAGSPLKKQLSKRGGSFTRRRHNSNSESEDTEKQPSAKRQVSFFKKGKGKSTEEEPEVVKKILTKAEKEELWDKDIPEVSIY